jgi:hypothetical protein
VPGQVSSQPTNALHVVSETHDVPAAVVHVEFWPFISSVIRQEVQADEGVPLGQAAVHALLQGEPAAQAQSARR